MKGLSLTSAFCTLVSVLTMVGTAIRLATSSVEWKTPLGLFYGLAGVAIAQAVTMIYQYNRRELHRDTEAVKMIQLRPVKYDRSFADDVKEHFQRGELLLLVPYLALTWVVGLMPASYYDVEAPMVFKDVVLQLIVVDFFTYCFHLAEHEYSSWYLLGHKAHHKFTNPQLFNAFDATISDAVFLILFPLFATSQLCTGVSCWSYVAFGMAYSTHFMLIHSEFEHDFDPFLRCFFVNTAADHHVHHKAFKYNFGHFFTIYDQIGGTYRHPRTLKGMAMYDASDNETEQQSAISFPHQE